MAGNVEEREELLALKPKRETRKQEAAAGGTSRGERREHVAGSWADLNDGHQLCPLILCEPAVNDVPNHKDTVSWDML